MEVLNSPATHQPPTTTTTTTLTPNQAPTKLRDQTHYLTAAAQLQHCLDVAPEVTLLGVKKEHLKAVMDNVKSERVSVMRWALI